ncbi:MAG: hypothetical protein LIR50_07235 [Bacillota bacterium]|nr:hypothetical protein [Bacillota bacterium]
MKMLEEVKYNDDIKLILLQKEEFWDTILPSGLEDSQWIDIATYNFDFKNIGDQTFYNKLKMLTNKGFEIRFVFSKAEEDQIFIEPLMAKSIYIIQNEQNHTKIMLTENLGYIGSADFSFGNGDNYECGFLIMNKSLIKEIREKVFIKLLNGNEISKPNPGLYNKVVNLFDTSTNILNNFGKLKDEELKNLLYELRFYSEVAEEIKNTFNIDFSVRNFDFSNFADKIDYSLLTISSEEFLDFHESLNELNESCKLAKKKIQSAYSTQGREKFLEGIQHNTDPKYIRDMLS